MLVTSTELQNNFGKYLELCRKEQIIVKKNGKKRALLLSWPRNGEGRAGGLEGEGGTDGRPSGWVTYREFLELTEESEQRYELIDGVVYMLGAPGGVGPLSRSDGGG
ncbi:MAG: hypothetical protein WCY01_03225 [Alkalispirochaeta sp.]